MVPRPQVTVVVATYGRARLLPRLVGAVEAQTGVGPVELVIVDDGSGDGTWPVLDQLAGQAAIAVVALRLDRNQGPARARNLGWRAARAPLVAFTDDDCVPQPGWLAALVAGSAEADIVQGVTRPDPAQIPGHGAFSQTVRVNGDEGWYETCNIAYRRELLERLGGFDERFGSASRGGRPPYGEDTDLAWRAKQLGARIVLAPGAVVHHEVWPDRFVHRLAEASRRDGLVRMVKAHPGLRSQMTWGVFWRASHPPALLAGAALALVARRPRSLTTWTWAGPLGLPYLYFRLRVEKLPGRTRYRLAVVGLVLVADLVDVAALAVSSVRHRTLLL